VILKTSFKKLGGSHLIRTLSSKSFKDIVLKPFYSQAMSSSEAELREALAAARAMGVEPELLEEAEAMLCTKAAESELLSAMELVRSFELGGEVDEETWS